LPDSRWKEALSEKPPEHRRPDPLRREPPTLDLKAKEVKPGPAQPARSGSDKTVSGATPKAAPARNAGPTAKAAATPAPAPKPAASPVPSPAAAAQAAANIPSRRRPSIDGGATPAAATQATKPAPAAPPAPQATPASPPRPSATAGASAAGATAAAAVPPAASAATPRAAEAAAPAPTPKSGRGLGSLLTTGLLGGLVGAGLVYGADHYLADRAGSNVSPRLAALEQRAAAPAGPTGDVSGLDRRIATLEAAQRDLTDQVAAARRAADATGPAGAAAPAAGADATQAIGALTTRLSALEEAARQSGSAQETNTSALNEIRTQVAALRTGLNDQTKQSGAAAQTNAAALAEIGSRLTALQSQAAGQAQAATTALEAMQGRLNDDEKRLGALAAEMGRFGPSAAQAGLRIIVASRLSDALRDGQPLGPLLATVQKIGAPAEVTAPLQPYANAAPPSPAALAQEFEPLGRRIIEASRGPASTIGERLLRMTDRIVTVRNVGDAGGTDVAAQVDRIETALARGALSEAATSWDALPDGGKQISAEWASRLKQRAAAGDAARRLSSDALSSIDASLR
jgi:hypothetical protein